MATNLTTLPTWYTRTMDARRAQSDAAAGISRADLYASGAAQHAEDAGDASLCWVTDVPKTLHAALAVENSASLVYDELARVVRAYVFGADVAGSRDCAAEILGTMYEILNHVGAMTEDALPAIPATHRRRTRGAIVRIRTALARLDEIRTALALPMPGGDD